MSRQHIADETNFLPGYNWGMVNPDRIRPFEDIAARLRVIRSIEGLEQRPFAEGAGLKHTQYKNWESGAYRISLDGALALREHYGVTLEYIYLGEVESLPRSWRQDVSSISQVKS